MKKIVIGIGKVLLAWMIGFVAGFAPIAGYNFIRDWGYRTRDILDHPLKEMMNRSSEIADYAAYTLAGLTLALVIYLTFKRDWEWKPWKIAFVLGLFTLPAMFTWALNNITF